MEKHDTLVAKRTIEMLEDQDLVENNVAQNRGVEDFSIKSSETATVSFTQRCIDRGLPITTLSLPALGVH